jgi:hypothetical protein
MGNRANVIFPEARVAVYLHWNGGLESVVAFLDYMNERRIGADSYGAARFCQIVGNFFGGELSLGVDGCGTHTVEFRALADGMDGGAYVIGRNQQGLCVARWFRRHTYGDPVCEVPPHELAEFVTRARAHAYNRDGAMLADIRAKNAHTVKEEA